MFEALVGLFAEGDATFEVGDEVATEVSAVGPDVDDVHVGQPGPGEVEVVTQMAHRSQTQGVAMDGLVIGRSIGVAGQHQGDEGQHLVDVEFDAFTVLLQDTTRSQLPLTNAETSRPVLLGDDLEVTVPAELVGEESVRGVGAFSDDRSLAFHGRVGHSVGRSFGRSVQVAFRLALFSLMALGDLLHGFLGFGLARPDQRRWNVLSLLGVELEHAGQGFRFRIGIGGLRRGRIRGRGRGHGGSVLGDEEKARHFRETEENFEKDEMNLTDRFLPSSFDCVV